MEQDTIKAVIFDMDGVLVDSQPFHFDVDWHVLQKNGVFVEKTIIHRYAGMSNQDRWKKYIVDYHINATESQLIHDHVTTIMSMLDNYELQATLGVKDLIQQFKKEGYLVSVASSSSFDFIYKMLEKIGLRELFDYIVSGEAMEKGKPAPDIFLHSAEKLGATPSQCVVFEDAANGVAAAVAAGMPCIGYRNESSGNQDLSKATIVIDSFQDFLKNFVEKGSFTNILN